MTSIWKFPLSVQNEPVAVEMPRAADVFHVAGQGGSPCLWAVVDTEAPKETRRFLTIGTGWELPDEHGYYLGTAHCGALVWHVFEAFV